MNEEELFKKLTSSFIEDMKAQLEDLETSINPESKEGLIAFGHTLKGSGAMFGLPQISELGIKLEEEARGDRWNEVRLTATMLKKELKKQSD